MNLLLDENLSPRLAERLKSLFSGIMHVRDAGLSQVTDERIWKWALDNGFTVITADSDFVALSERLGWPPKVVHIKRCNFRFRVIEDILPLNAIRISEFVRDPARGLFVLVPPAP